MSLKEREREREDIYMYIKLPLFLLLLLILKNYLCSRFISLNKGVFICILNNIGQNIVVFLYRLETYTHTHT
jgi:ABC-type polysaccharide transport system permease subunit